MGTESTVAKNLKSATIKNTGKKVGIGIGAIIEGGIGDAFNIASAVGTMKASQEEGDHIAVTVAKGASDFIISEMFYGAMGNGGIVAGVGGGIAMAGLSVAANLTAQHMANTGQKMGQGTESLKGLGSGHFDMTQAGYTMRQRSLNAIRSNGANINSAFGNEARNYWLGL
jgi:hypothetical protein